MDDIIIRRADAGDIDTLTELDSRCFTNPWKRDSFEHELKENGIAFYLVAEIDGRAAGYAGLWLIVDEGHITNVAVLPEYRRRHVASGLMEALIAGTRDRGIVDYTLEVRRGNEAALQLYRNYGFVRTGVRRKYYEDNGEDAIIMWRREDKE